MTSDHCPVEQELLHYSEWQDRFFSQLLTRVLCPLLQRQTEAADFSSLEKHPLNCSLAAIVWSNGLFPASLLVLVGTGTPPAFWRQSLGALVLKWEQDHLPPLACDLFRHNLWLSIQIYFIVSKVLSFGLKWTLCSVRLMFRCWSCFWFSVYENYCCVAMDCSVGLCLQFKLTYMYSSAARTFLYFYPITGHLLFFPMSLRWVWEMAGFAWQWKGNRWKCKTCRWCRGQASPTPFLAILLYLDYLTAVAKLIPDECKKWCLKIRFKWVADLSFQSLHFIFSICN